MSVKENKKMVCFAPNKKMKLRPKPVDCLFTKNSIQSPFRML